MGSPSRAAQYASSRPHQRRMRVPSRCTMRTPSTGATWSGPAPCLRQRAGWRRSLRQSAAGGSPGRPALASGLRSTAALTPSPCNNRACQSTRGCNICTQSYCPATGPANQPASVLTIIVLQQVLPIDPRLQHLGVVLRTGILRQAVLAQEDGERRRGAGARERGG